MKVCFHPAMIILALALWMAAPRSATVLAAIRVCHDVVASDIASDLDELTAKKKALDQWRAKAAAFGEGFDAWRVAANKALQCFQKDGHFECVALGAPCLIQQNPNQRPAGKDRKGEPL